MLTDCFYYNLINMDRKQRVFLKLKPKTKALGFNKKELMGIAAKIADNLTSEENASDEDVDAEIDSQIEAALPYLSFGQSYANRLLDDERKKKNEKSDDEEEEEIDEHIDKPHHQDDPKKNNPKNNGKNDDAPAWAKGLVQTVKNLNDELIALKGEKVTASRKSKLESLLKDTGTFGTRTLKSFSRMKFDNDEEFEEFFSEVEEDLKAYNQERADEGLSAMGNPPSGGKGGQEKKDEPFSDEEIDAMADKY